MLRLRDVSPVPQQEDDPDDDQNSSADDTRMSAEAVRKLFPDLVNPPTLSHYADPFPNTDMTNTQLVPYVKDSAKPKTVSDTDELDTQNGLFQKYQLFHLLSGDQDREAHTSAYHELMNLMLSQTTKDKQLINVSATRPKSECPFHSNLEKLHELKKQDKLHLQWPPIKETQRVISRTLGLDQHGQQPQTGSSSSQWPPPTVENPWDKEFTPKDFPTTHKIPSTLPKQWELH